MTIEELISLRNEASQVSGKWIEIKLCCHGDILIDVAGISAIFGTIDLAIGYLQKMATPPKPATITITVPYDVAEEFSHRDKDHPSAVELAMSKACANAVKPYVIVK